MRKKTRRTLVALLSLVMLLALAPVGFAESDFNTVFTDPNTVTVDLAKTNDNINGTDAEKPYDLTKANVVVDLYKIAGVTKDPKFETYSFNFADMTAFDNDLVNRFKAAVTAENKNAVDWNKADETFADLGNEISKVVLQDIKSDNPTFTAAVTAATAEGKITLSNVPAALYLMVPHGSDDDLKTPADYIIEKKQTDSEETWLRTIAKDEMWKYVFTPQLLSLPGKTMDADTQSYEVQQYNTAYGEWTNSITVVLKPAPEPNIGDLRIIKILDTFAGPDPATFEFEIRWKEKTASGGIKENVSYAQITFNEKDGPEAAGEYAGKYYDECIIKGFPIGTEVTVEEVHAGIKYHLVAGIENPQTATIVAVKSQSSTDQQDGDNTSAAGENDIATVIFENDHGRPGGGYGIVNRFVSDGNKHFKVYRHEETDGPGKELPSSGNNS